MKPIVKTVLAAALVLGLCACGTPPAKTSNLTVIQPLNQVEWAEKIAADHAATVGNNGLIMMR